MLYNLEKKIGIVIVPKTGSIALHRIIESRVHLDYNTHDHISVERIVKLLEFDGHDSNYNVIYSVVRDPVDRFISCCNYFRYNWPRYGLNLLDYHGIEYDYFDTINPHTKYRDLIESATIIDVINSFKAVMASGSQDKINKRMQLWQPYCFYLDYPRVQLLDYRDMLGSVNTILEAFEADPVDSVPHINVTEDKKFLKENLTSEEIAAIRDFYKEDYEFFEKKGISFDV